VDGPKERDGGNVRSLTPWLWLVDFDAQGKALDASERPTGELAAALMAHFAELHVLRSDSASLDAFRAVNNQDGWAPSSIGVGSVSTAPWPQETFDCIAVHDALLRRRLTETEWLAELRSAHRLLKRGGWLAITSSQPPRLFGSQASSAAGIPRAVLSRRLTNAGFREIRCLFVEPAADAMFTVVPDTKAAVKAHDTLAGSRGLALWRRRAVAALGFRSALFPAYVLLARA
jgi:hypothetical protein